MNQFAVSLIYCFSISVYQNISDILIFSSLKIFSAFDSKFSKRFGKEGCLLHLKSVNFTSHLPRVKVLELQEINMDQSKVDVVTA